MNRKKWIILSAVIVVLALALSFFAVPRSLIIGTLIPEAALPIEVVRRVGTEHVDITDQLDLDALEEFLEDTKCRPIMDATRSYSGDRAQYDIRINTKTLGVANSFVIHLGVADGKGETTLINKMYNTFRANGIFPSLKYKVLNPEALIAYLDSCA